MEQVKGYPKYTAPTSGGHITVVETIYYQRPGRDPVACEIGFTQRIKSGEPRAIIECPIGSEKMDIPSDASMIVVKNTGVRVRAVNSTQEQIDAEESAVAKVMVNGIYFAIVQVGQSMRFQPCNGFAYSVEYSASAVIEIHVFPR